MKTRTFRETEALIGKLEDQIGPLDNWSGHALQRLDAWLLDIQRRTHIHVNRLHWEDPGNLAQPAQWEIGEAVQPKLEAKDDSTHKSVGPSTAASVTPQANEYLPRRNGQGHPTARPDAVNGSFEGALDFIDPLNSAR